MLSLPNVYSQRLPEDVQSTYLYAHGYKAQDIYSLLAIDFHSYQALGIYTATGGWANRTEYVSSVHPPVQLHFNIPTSWALDTYSTVTPKQPIHPISARMRLGRGLVFCWTLSLSSYYIGLGLVSVPVGAGERAWDQD